MPFDAQTSRTLAASWISSSVTLRASVMIAPSMAPRLLFVMNVARSAWASSIRKNCGIDNGSFMLAMATPPGSTASTSMSVRPGWMPEIVTSLVPDVVACVIV